MSGRPEPARPAPAGRAPHGASDAPPPTVLVVDDTEGNRYTVVRILRGAGMRILEAATGRDALREARAAIPDLIVLDVHLPDFSGFDVSQRLRADAATAHIPIMHVSASVVATADQAKGLELGADAYLTHPVEPMLLLATARALLRARAAEAQAQHAAAEWQATFDAIEDPVLLLDGEGCVLRANDAAAALASDATREAIVGRPLSALVPLAPPEVRAQLERAQRGQASSGEEVALAGRRFMLRTSAVPTGPGSEARTVCVLADVTARHEHLAERERLLEAAETARVEAERASRVKSDFLATMSHELRTPLNALLGYVDLLAMGVPGPVNAQQGAYLGRVRTSSMHLLGLVDDVLDLGKLNAGQLRTERHPAWTSDVVSAAFAMLEPSAEARGVSLVDENAGERGVVYLGDEHRTRQILVNLLGNAIKFTDRGGTVRVHARAVDGSAPIASPLGDDTVRRWMRLDVTDTGSGIASDRLEAIFEPFVQAQTGHTRAQGGTGLGLTISRHLARLMGGELTVESAVGTGSRFTLWLPAGEGE